MPNTDHSALAQEILNAFDTGAPIATPLSARDADFDMNDAYAVEAEFARLRQAAGHKLTGLKVGYANKAMWRILKLDTLVWAHMYDDTVHDTSGGEAVYTLPPHRAPKIEPEIVFKLREPIAIAGLDAATVLSHVEWLAAGFEIIDCPFPDWQFKPVDFVAAFGLHLGLVIGEPLQVTPELIPTLVEKLASFKVKVARNGEFIEEGSGKNSLRSPALCVAELAGALVRRNQTPLAAGDLISSGTLTAGHPIARGETWRMDIEMDGDGVAIPGLQVNLK